MELLSGNEAIARGAYEAGVTLAAGYPGTPSTEILENIVQYKDVIYAEWSPNEKVAFEVAAAAAMAGARSLVTMKHVGLNVAADPLMTLAYIGVKGGMVIVVADDPGMHSSQNEQDSRNYAKFAKIPLLEPSDSQEAKDFMLYAYDLSEKYGTPVILKTETRISHSRSLTELGTRGPENKTDFIKDQSKHVMVPLWARGRRVQLESRIKELKKAANESEINRIEMQDTSLGIITSGVTYQYVKEAWPNASILKLGFVFPFPDELIKEFASKVKNVLIIEQLDDFIEEHVKALGIKCNGKDVIPNIGEISPSILLDIKAKMEAGSPISAPYKNIAEKLPGRPPVLCAGCSHRGIFHALTEHDVVIAGDIGCYSLGTFKPLERLDIILCMGGGISMAHGMQKANNSKKVVGVIGDSTFFHSGITGLIDIVYNKGTSTIIVLDNRITAMTGHQENPGSGSTLMGEPTVALSIAEIGRACGVKRIFEINPYDQKNTKNIIAQEIEINEPSLIISKAPCVLYSKKPINKQRSINQEKCKNCRQCLRLGCPAIEADEGKPHINPHICMGCSLCQQACKFDAITELEDRTNVI
ncbi:MAG: indolepyruvate ferredoxin oxidoreductase subunit alpha [Candidatus Omnitrophica bacterium]|nr:indolepyruvate ferredoxin oxidoreductase subunit alpha [Candidatus Omnitrophota bacterium]